MIIVVVHEVLGQAAYNQILVDASHALIVNKLRASLKDKEIIAPTGSKFHSCYVSH